MSEATAVFTPSELGQQWASAQFGSATFVWRFSQNLREYRDANPKAKLAELGAEIGKHARKDGSPYSKTWVSRALKAGRDVPRRTRERSGRMRIPRHVLWERGSTRRRDEDTHQSQR